MLLVCDSPSPPLIAVFTSIWSLALVASMVALAIFLISDPTPTPNLAIVTEELVGKSGRGPKFGSYIVSVAAGVRA